MEALYDSATTVYLDGGQFQAAYVIEARPRVAEVSSLSVANITELQLLMLSLITEV